MKSYYIFTYLIFQFISSHAQNNVLQLNSNPKESILRYQIVPIKKTTPSIADDIVILKDVASIFKDTQFMPSIGGGGGIGTGSGGGVLPQPPTTGELKGQLMPAKPSAIK